MLSETIIRAWKDQGFYADLSEAERAALPPHPAGVIALTDEIVDRVAGGGTELLLTLGCCKGLTTAPQLCSFACGTAACTNCIGTCPTALTEC
jgi:mersacidin/lichenicidin family type 2 lantibiotic